MYFWYTMSTYVAKLRLLTGLLLVALLGFTSCSKDEPLAPRCHQENNEAVGKSLNTLELLTDSKPTSIIKSGDGTVDDGTDSAISDDGDDLSGSEGRKPKI